MNRKSDLNFTFFSLLCWVRHPGVCSVDFRGKKNI
jgi:hypothetical protein